MRERWGASYRFLVTFAVMIGTIATILSATIVNVALPQVMGAFGIGQDHAQLIATAFLAAVTSTMLLNGWLVDSFGCRLTYAAAIILFVLGSIISGAAPNEGVLILGRVLQGAAAGMIQPLGMQIIFQVFPAERRGAAMGLYAVGVVLAPALGPAVGGVIVDGAGWRAVFFLGVPFALAGLALGLVFLPGPSHGGQRRRFDGPGFLLLVLALLALLTGLSSGQREGWESNRVMVELGLALCAAVGFVLWELRTETPMLNPRLFTVRAFACSAAVGLVYGAALFGSTYLVPLFAQTVQGYTATRAGLLLMPAGLAMVLVFPIGGRLADRFPPWMPIGAGLLLFGTSSLLMHGIGTDTPYWTLAIWMLIGRIGFGFAMPSMNAGALRALPPKWVGQGSGAVNFARQFGGAMGVNLLSIILERRTQFHVQALNDTQTGGPATRALLDQVERLLAQDGVAEPLRQAAAENFLSQMLLSQASMLAFRDSFLAVALICAAALVPVAIMRRR
ncbi:DHA2 family efflux MFS transporter permease subunit [Roseomonas sp. HJA6]|uniref:DHA2 family efflux MFS transporter permease subunit n=2 Tax=Roseomonas alba TaxID=2846776 RepID=A0ABS7ACH0_9PROT|nr:DHA2 family efflux MFS transporter permease subunit [Neoroseomonas alba]MBW6398869.1 DHA2 family efflux MFS transporter permease subunit [Neoroseomonas alba]